MADVFLRSKGSEVKNSAVSFINYKGGVGKTTLTVETAAGLAAWDKVRVLICDVDPQTNASIYLMDPEGWSDWADKHGTVRDIFRAAMSGHNDINLADRIYHYESPEGIGIDLLPSHPELMRDEPQLATQFGAAGLQAATILRKALTQVKGQYDVILFDCPPNLGLVTQNALVASDAYVIAAMPEYLSTYGIKILHDYVSEMSTNWGSHATQFGGTFAGPQLKGIIFNRVKYLTGGTKSQERQMSQVRSGNLGHLVFDSEIAETDRFPQRAEINIPIVLSQSSSDSPYKKQVESVVREFIEKVV